MGRALSFSYDSAAAKWRIRQICYRDPAFVGHWFPDVAKAVNGISDYFTNQETNPYARQATPEVKDDHEHGFNRDQQKRWKEKQHY